MLKVGTCSRRIAAVNAAWSRAVTMSKYWRNMPGRSSPATRSATVVPSLRVNTGPCTLLRSSSGFSTTLPSGCRSL
jgi:hypothetical protein